MEHLLCEDSSFLHCIARIMPVSLLLGAAKGTRLSVT